MPSIKKGESEKDYVSRCIPIRMKEKGEDADKAAAACHGMYKEHKEKGTQYDEKCNPVGISEQTFSLTMTLKDFIDSENKSLGKLIEFEKEINGRKVKFTKIRAVAVIGDRFMKETFIPTKELMMTVSEWNGTIHDLSHMGTSYPDPNPANGFTRQNIEYIVGYNDEATFDPKTKELFVTVNISHESPHYQAWKNYIDICEVSGKTPNVSMSVMCNRQYVTVDEVDIPSDVAQGYGLKANDVILYMSDIHPRALTTCFKGVCSDAHGCGIKINHEEDATCSCGKNDKQQCGASADVKSDNPDECPCKKEREAYLEKRIKSLKGGNQ